MKSPRVLTGTHFMLGNHAVVEGALAAGCDFFAGYPITPANEILERMAQRLPQVGGKFLQAEDEMCAIFAVTGAVLAGAKAMTATASAGFSYMQEAIGYAVAAEIPCVIVDVQRVRGENYATQADVMQMRWGADGDYEIIVLAPSSVQELFDYTIKAFNFAEKYRNPVIVMSEATIALAREKLVIPEPEKIQIIERKKPSIPPKEFLPFAAGSDGVPPLPSLGEGYRVLHSHNPHDERGDIRWDPDAYERMYKRILGKIADHRYEIAEAEGFFVEDAETLLIAYGSESRVALQVVHEARARGLKIGLLKLVTVWPIPEKQIKEAAQKVATVIVLEMNVGKYVNEIERVLCGRDCKIIRATKNRGEVHTPEEIYSLIIKRRE
ncbi:MAG: 2-oxoacid:acceptor oxidoreductase subunit alpha [Candidatus Bathyarchaeia archaeon]